MAEYEQLYKSKENVNFSCVDRRLWRWKVLHCFKVTSCFNTRYVKGMFPQNKMTTIGVEFASKNITLKNGTKVKA